METQETNDQRHPNHGVYQTNNYRTIPVQTDAIQDTWSFNTYQCQEKIDQRGNKSYIFGTGTGGNKGRRLVANGSILYRGKSSFFMKPDQVTVFIWSGFWQGFIRCGRVSNSYSLTGNTGKLYNTIR